MPTARQRTIASSRLAPAALAGTWKGTGRPIVNWCRTESFPMRLEVDAAGGVSGRIGDAQLTHGRLTRNRPWFLSGWPVFTDFIVQGELQGALLGRERVRRRKVSLPLDFKGGLLVGALHTDGLDLFGLGPTQAKKFSALVSLGRAGM